MFSLLKCHSISKNHKDIRDPILVTEGGGLQLEIAIPQKPPTFQFEIIYVQRASCRNGLKISRRIISQ